MSGKTSTQTVMSVSDSNGPADLKTAETNSADTKPVDVRSPSDAVTNAPGALASRPTLAKSRAARELELKRGEFDLAVRLGRIRTVPDEGAGGHRVTRAEIDRVKSEEGFPEVLRERVKAVGTSEGAALMNITAARFTRFARLGLVVPVKYYLNRYRAVVWLYLAEELRQFADNKEHAPLMNGRVPERLRDQLDAGLDLRARNWRGRHLGFALRQTEDPWARVAAVASLLDPIQVAEIVSDPYERAYMDRYRPDQDTHGAPDSPSARITARIMTAVDPDEISWLRADLANGLEEARDHRPAPRPTTEPGAPPVDHDRPAPLGVRRPPIEHRMPTEHRRPAALRQATKLRHPADVRQLTEVRRPTELQHPVSLRHPVPLRRPAEQPQPAEQRQPAEAQQAVDKPERPRGLLGRLRRRHP
ncbi:DUF6397 family protein [Streptomyces sp. NPDC048484]|uniref:DUF6397 family protein n=1 Tax=Streptomyces sp. NPDC048484 TaxID=3155146 RepID=UPI00342624A3